jgi:hypothetical protein
VDFTREPIIETVITPREGSKLVVRSSKAVGQEEYFVDSVEVVSFGNAIFFRSTEKPKAFLLPVTDFEVLEVREARIVLKNVGVDRSIKIAGGREAAVRAPKESSQEERSESQQAPQQEISELKQERKKERRRHGRRRRGREEAIPNGEVEGAVEKEGETVAGETVQVPVFSPLLTPPPLISETISRYKEQFKDAFYSKEDESSFVQGEEFSENTVPEIPLMQPAFGSFENSEEDEEEIYRQRKRRLSMEQENIEPEQPIEEKKTEEPDPTV